MDLTELGSIEQLDGLDLTNVNTERPLFKDGDQVTMKLEKLEVKPSKTKGKENNKNLYITLLLDTAAMSKDGKTLNPGFKHTEIMSLTPTENFDPREGLAKLQLCFTGGKGAFKRSELEGQRGAVKMRIESDPQYGDKNRVSTWVPKKAESAPTLGA